MSAVKVAIGGAAGRMGQALVRAIAQTPDFSLVGACEHPGHAQLGLDAGRVAGLDPLGAVLTADTQTAGAAADVWIDFSTPAATLAALGLLPERVAAVVGATGFDSAQEAALASAARARRIVRSGNFSLGVNVLAGLVRQAAKLLGPDWDIEIVEAHHRAKLDAPSGTALMLGEAAALGRGATLGELRLPAREGLAGPRPAGGIGFAAVRGGGIVGEHSALFATGEEMIRLEHVALDRGLFAKGALAAARWAATGAAIGGAAIGGAAIGGAAPGLFSMQDVLGL